jgi:hypothetical protein
MFRSKYFPAAIDQCIKMVNPMLRQFFTKLADITGCQESFLFEILFEDAKPTVSVFPASDAIPRLGVFLRQGKTQWYF